MSKMNIKGLVRQTIDDKLSKLVMGGTSNDDCGICGCACKDNQGNYSEQRNYDNGMANRRAGKASPNGGILWSGIHNSSAM